MRSPAPLLSVTALALVTASGVFAQTRPDLSGTWTFDPTSLPADAGGPGGISPPRQLTLAQDADTFTISFSQSGTPTTLTYNLDGSASRNPDGVSMAAWQDDRLVIVTSQTFGGREIEQRRVLWRKGDELVLELPGAGEAQGDEPAVVQLVYTQSE